MKSTLIRTLAATAVVLAGGVYAQEATSDAWMKDARQSAAREEVRQELFRARAAGELPPIGEADIRIAAGNLGVGVLGRRFVPDAQTREAVRQEFFRARAAGTLPPIGEGPAGP